MLEESVDKKPFVWLIVLALAYGVVWAGYGQAQKRNAVTQAWEYKTIYIDFHIPVRTTWFEDAKPLAGTPNMITKSNELGSAGWELVSVTAFGPGDRTPDVIYWFKRPK